MPAEDFGKNVAKVFKIDLIVWKYRISCLEFPDMCLFKIDLIVWKLL